jgi:hypothetical protein
MTDLMFLAVKFKTLSVFDDYSVSFFKQTKIFFTLFDVQDFLLQSLLFS